MGSQPDSNLPAAGPNGSPGGEGSEPARKSPSQAPEPRCGFCGGGAVTAPDPASSVDKGSAKEKKKNFPQDVGGGGFERGPAWLGPLLGPLSERIGVAGVWVHRECAVWSPEVYFVHGTHLKNVQAALRRGRALRCSRCGKAGATMGCWMERCQRTFHLPCARAEGCQFHHKAFLVTCVEHTPEQQPRPQAPPPASRNMPTSRKFGRTRSQARHALGCTEKRRRAAAIEADRTMLATMRLEALLAQGRLADLANDEEDFQKRERRRLARDLARIVPLRLGGDKPDSVKPEDFAQGWESVAGLQDVIKSLKEVVLLPLLYPHAFAQFGIPAARGILLHGNPGTGKTLVCRALAGACARSANRQIAYFARKGADCLGKYVGDAERQLRLLFQVAEQNQPSIIFFDEIDGLAPERTARQDQTQSSVVSTLLALMDGLNPRGSVVVIGATNRPEAIDPALRRPGRFDREIYFPLPTSIDRAAILHLHTQKWDTPPAPPVLAEVARVTSGFAGADLAGLCTQAVMAALKRTSRQLIKKMDGHTKPPPPLPPVKVEASDWATALAKAPPPCSRRQSAAVINEPTTVPIPWHLAGPLALPFAAILLGLAADTRIALLPQAQTGVRRLREALVSAGEGQAGKGKTKKGVDLEGTWDELDQETEMLRQGAEELEGSQEADLETSQEKSSVGEAGTGGQPQDLGRDQGSDKEERVNKDEGSAKKGGKGSKRKHPGEDNVYLGPQKQEPSNATSKRGLQSRVEGPATNSRATLVDQVVSELVGAGLIAAPTGGWEAAATIEAAEKLAQEGANRVNPEGPEVEKGTEGPIAPGLEQAGASGFRVLISGQGNQGQAMLASGMLSALERFGNVRVVAFPTMVLMGSGDPTEGLTLILEEARQAAPCVVFMPQLESWAAQKMQAVPAGTDDEELRTTTAGTRPSKRPHKDPARHRDNNEAKGRVQRASDEVFRPKGGASEMTIQGSEDEDLGGEETSAVHGGGGLVVSAAWKVLLQHMASMPGTSQLALLATTHVSGEVLPDGILEFFAEGGRRTAPLGSSIDLLRWECTLQGHRAGPSNKNEPCDTDGPRLPNLNRGGNPALGWWGDRKDAVGDFATPEASAVKAKTVHSIESKDVRGNSVWGGSMGQGGQVGSSANAVCLGQRKAVAQQSKAQRGNMSAFWVEMTIPTHAALVSVFKAATHSIALQLAEDYVNNRPGEGGGRKRKAEGTPGGDTTAKKEKHEEWSPDDQQKSTAPSAGDPETPGSPDAHKGGTYPTKEEKALQSALAWCGYQLMKAPAYARMRRASLLLGPMGRPRAADGGLVGIGQRACSCGFSSGQELQEAVRKVLDEVRRREERRLLMLRRQEGPDLVTYSSLLRACASLEDTLSCWLFAMRQLAFAARTARELLAPEDRWVPPTWTSPPKRPPRPSIGRSGLRVVSFGEKNEGGEVCRDKKSDEPKHNEEKDKQKEDSQEKDGGSKDERKHSGDTTQVYQMDGFQNRTDDLDIMEAAEALLAAGKRLHLAPPSQSQGSRQFEEAKGGAEGRPKPEEEPRDEERLPVPTLRLLEDVGAREVEKTSKMEEASSPKDQAGSTVPAQNEKVQSDSVCKLASKRKWCSDCFQLLDIAVGEALLGLVEQHIQDLRASSGKAGGRSVLNARRLVGFGDREVDWWEALKRLGINGLSLEEVAEMLAAAGYEMKVMVDMPSHEEAVPCMCGCSNCSVSKHVEMWDAAKVHPNDATTNEVVDVASSKVDRFCLGRVTAAIRCSRTRLYSI